MKKPLVSIIIPVYNGSNFMREAIDSALSQTYDNIEVIVVNDGSTDETDTIASSYGDRIRYFKKENGGVSSALNLGIKKMKGEYFSWLSHDDKYNPEKIARQIDILQNHLNEDVVAYCKTSLIDKNSTLIRNGKLNPFLLINSVNKWDDTLTALLKEGCFGGCALLIPKRAFDKAGYFDESLRYSQDLLMWAKIFLNKFSLVYCDANLVMSRVHDKQLTNHGNDIFFSDTEIIAKTLYDDLKRSSFRINFVYHFAKYCAKYRCDSAFRYVLQKGKEDKVLDSVAILKLYLLATYGKIRPLIRKVYYKLKQK